MIKLSIQALFICLCCGAAEYIFQGMIPAVQPGLAAVTVLILLSLLTLFANIGRIEGARNFSAQIRLMIGDEGFKKLLLLPQDGEVIQAFLNEFGATAMQSLADSKQTIADFKRLANEWRTEKADFQQKLAAAEHELRQTVEHLNQWQAAYGELDRLKPGQERADYLKKLAVTAQAQANGMQNKKPLIQ